ncbi:eukaryotic translation initiation factor 2 subunit 2-like isoform X2 [Tigriopus californicus]|nr:eukaryotic translation initiation factor 2 subunit 2-like isoform X2 [Tigriopus californicus]
MTEDDQVFDPSLKKKKKKKITPFDLGGTPDLDGAMKDDEGEAPTAEAAEEVAGPQTTGPPEDDLDLDNLSKKKKKKKKKKLVLDGGEDEDEAHEAADPDLDLPEIPDDIDLESFGKKKKKKKQPLNLDELDDALPDEKEDDEVDLESFGKKKKKKKRAGELGGDDMKDDDKENVEANPWVDSDRDYTYDELLQRVFNIMRDKNPELVAGEKKRFVMRPPQVVRVGTKKTAFVNFTEIAKMLHRQPKHLLAFLFAELGTVGAIDGNNQLIIKGRFQQKHIENVLRRYIKEYVTCHTCRSPDTILDKETRLFFLQCMSCHSRCSVQTIKTGFQAITSKRSKTKQ